jgi:hypothetical protein
MLKLSVTYQHLAAVDPASGWSASTVVLQRLGVNGGGAIAADLYDRLPCHQGLFTHFHQLPQLHPLCPVSIYHVQVPLRDVPSPTR